LIEIESINILDLEPPAAISGIGTGTAMVVGEFEDGPFNVATEVSGADDLAATFGSFGYRRGGTVANDPCARARKADSAVNPEFWNGNAMAQLTGKRFARLVCVRVDTSVGAVRFTRQAAVLGAAKPSYQIQNAQTLSFDVGGGALTATFSAAAAVMNGAGGTFAIVGGETVTLAIDAMPQFTVTFLSTDNSVAAAAARINQYAGFTLATTNAGQLVLTSRQLGSGAKVQVVAFDAGGTATKLGLTVSTQNGTGNVADSNAVTFAELKTVVEAAAAGVKIDQTSDLRPRASFVTTPGTGTITVVAPQTATDFGFVVGDTAGATGPAGTIAAGTVVKTGGGVRYLTMQDVDVLATNAGPYEVKIRHALDDGTGTSSLAGSITVVDSSTPIDFGSFAVINLVPTTNALTEAALDAAYEFAFDQTLDVNTVAKEVNLSWSARQSNACRRKGKDNALFASANGCFGRLFAARPPLGTLKSIAKGNAEPGVGPYRDQRLVYCYPGARALLPAMAQVGTAGGAGFTADGVIDQGSDGWLCSVCSQLAPEENPGQDAGLMGNVVGLESSPNVQGFTIVDYTDFRAKGICALRLDGGVASFQSGVTSVDPSVQPNLRNIARRRMADFIQDTLANALKGFAKKLSTVKRRAAVVSEVRGFLRGLKSPENPSAQRIADFDVAPIINAVELAQGLFRLKIAVQTLSSLDSIVLQTTIGEGVDVSEAV
jgi:hypothetical protein